MPQYDYDLYVIGAGSGGVRAARMSATYGARVAIAENTYLGGTCVNVGCIPKKLFVYGSHFHEDFEDAKGFGWTVSKSSFSWPTLRDNKTKEIERLNGVYGQMLDNAGVALHWGQARLVDAHTIEVADKRYTAQNILVATGGNPWVPEFPGNEHAITSNEAFSFETFPKRALVVGGGYIAVEFAGIFNGLGAQTDLAYRGPLFLRGFDEEIREFVRRELDAKGINLRFESTIESIEREGAENIVHFGDGQSERYDLVLYATGRRPNTAGLGLSEAGVTLAANGSIVVDDDYRTSVEHIYAIGDVIDRVQLTPVAIAEGMCISNNLFTDKPTQRISYENIATAVFCQPNIGTVGLTEAQAQARYGTVDVFVSEFRPMKHTLTGRSEKTLMKLIVNQADDRVVGAHMVGPEAGEIIQGLAIALSAGLTKAQFDQTIAIHPTAAEEFVTMREAAR